MDPYLEGELWTDVHHELASAIVDRVMPQIAPQFVARISPYYVQDTNAFADSGILFPFLEPQRIPVIEVKVMVVEIQEVKSRNLITAIEILSPVNKRKPGLEPYREKRLRLHKAGVHLLEIDLIRRGERPFQHPMLPKAHYLALLSRAGSGRTDVWAFNIQEPLPVLPVPLKAPDPDAFLDLGAVLRDIYDRSRYDLSINYQETPPPPALTDEETAWIKENAR